MFSCFGAEVNPAAAKLTGQSQKPWKVLEHITNMLFFSSGLKHADLTGLFTCASIECLPKSVHYTSVLVIIWNYLCKVTSGHRKVRLVVTEWVLIHIFVIIITAVFALFVKVLCKLLYERGHYYHHMLRNTSQVTNKLQLQNQNKNKRWHKFMSQI